MKFKNILIVFFCFLSFLENQIFAQNTPNTISGRITNLEHPLRDVNIIVLETNKGTFTDAKGKYSITAYPGQILKFSLQGMKSVEIMVEDVTDYLNIKMIENTVELDEVVVEKKLRSKQDRLRIEFAENKKVYRSVFGFFNLDEQPYGAQIIDGEVLNAAAVDFISAIQGRISGARIIYRNGRKFITIRGGGVIYDVDGLITRTPPDFATNDIDRIVVLKSRSATIKYSGFGGGPVIIVNTKSGNYLFEPGTKEPYDRAKLRNNYYNNDAATNKNLFKGLPNYIKALKQSQSIEKAKQMYMKYRDHYDMNPYFFIDSYAFFLNMNEGSYAAQVLKDAKTVLSNNPVIAKAMAYQFEVSGQLKLANEQYQSVYKMRPSYAQSYRDLAESYRDLGNIKKAVSVYLRYEELVKDSLIASDSIIQPLIEREFDNLLILKGNELLTDTNEVTFVQTANSSQETRLLFEWNDSEAEFDLQFVNPDKQYYLWKHTSDSNAGRIKQEKLIGFSCKEFLIDDTIKGNWLINANYKGNKKLSPTYLKVSIYFNYGTRLQRKQVKVFRLGLKNVNQKLFELSPVNKKMFY